MVPALGVAIYVFGLQALALVLVSVAASVFFEWAYRKIMKKDSSIGDLSAVVTGMLLAFCMPANAPAVAADPRRFFRHRPLSSSSTAVLARTL